MLSLPLKIAALAILANVLCNWLILGSIDIKDIRTLQAIFLVVGFYCVNNNLIQVIVILPIVLIGLAYLPIGLLFSLCSNNRGQEQAPA